MRNEDSGTALQTSEVAPTRAATAQFEDKRPKAVTPAPTTPAPRLDKDSKAALA